jgi:S-layer homology domain.
MDNGVTWQDSATFSGLTPNTSYTLVTRVKETATQNASAVSIGGTFKTDALPAIGGTVSITGTAKYGETLTADTTAVVYTPSTGSDSTTYQWKRDGAAILGATSSSYTLVQADIGTVITVTVTADGTHARGSVTSEGAAAIAKADGASAPSAPALVSKTTSSITLTEVPGQEYSIDNGVTWQDSATFSGLTPNTSYTLVTRVKETATQNASAASAGGMFKTDSNPPSQPATPSTPETTNTGVDVLVNGKVENAGTATTTKVNDQTVTTITVDQKKLEDKLAAEGNNSVVTIPVNAKSEVIVSELNGQMVRNMESKQAVLEIKTDKASYTLPAEQINISAISNQIGELVALQDIKVQIEIAEPTADTVKVVKNAAERGSFQLVVPPVNFTVRATYGNTTVEVANFNTYIERTIAIPEGVDPSKITTGVVVEADGTVRHVPTKIVLIDGKYYAVINSLTNSTYSVVWHPVEFKDVANHWSKLAVNDMGSRMVIEGIGNGMFSPDTNITRAEFAAIIVRGLGLKLESGASSFPDVKLTDWYSSAISTAYAYHLISGFEDGTFRPNDKITREQAMVIIAKAMSITTLKDSLVTEAPNDTLKAFADAADASDWAKDSIVASVEAGIVSGRNGAELAPKAFITRAEVATIIQRLLVKSSLI